MKSKVTDLKTAVSVVKSDDVLLIGGFTNIGCPVGLVNALAAERGDEVKNLHTVSEDFGYDGYNSTQEALLNKGMVKEIIVSFFGHKSATKAVNEGKCELTLVPQGTLAERLRAAGAGIGGFYTPTGVGTVVEEGKEVKEINGKKYLLELPLKGNVAFVKCWKADTLGNGVFRYTANNFNPLMAMAADIVVLECEELVEPGEIEPDQVQLPGVFVDYVVQVKGEYI